MRESTERAEALHQQTATATTTFAADTIPRKSYNLNWRIAILTGLALVVAILALIAALPAALKDWPAILSHDSSPSPSSIQIAKPTNFALSQIGEPGLPILTAAEIHTVKVTVQRAPVKTRSRLRFAGTGFEGGPRNRVYVFDPGRTLPDGSIPGASGDAFANFKVLGEPPARGQAGG